MQLSDSCVDKEKTLLFSLLSKSSHWNIEGYSFLDQSNNTENLWGGGYSKRFSDEVPWNTRHLRASCFQHAAQDDFSSRIRRREEPRSVADSDLRLSLASRFRVRYRRPRRTPLCKQRRKRSMESTLHQDSRSDAFKLVKTCLARILREKL